MSDTVKAIDRGLPPPMAKKPRPTLYLAVAQAVRQGTWRSGMVTHSPKTAVENLRRRNPIPFVEGTIRIIEIPGEAA